MIFYQIFRPLCYLTVKDRSKWKIDWLIPAALALTTVATFAALPIRPQIFGGNGILDKTAAMLAILPGFYIAALAAIATFNKTDMDEYMPDPTPTVTVFVRGETVPIKLSRRRMLSLQFGYLSLLSLTLFVMVIAANALSESVKFLTPENLRTSTIIAFLLLFSLLFWHMVMVTFFGLYQLSDRMHQPDPDKASVK